MQVYHSDPIGFVWTKFGVEAGELVSEIIDRKERERRENGGLFLWGVGNNVGYSINALVTQYSPEVLFSPIVSAPRTCDVSPSETFAWTQAESLEGVPFSIPDGSLVTSRGGANKKFHYALVCYSDRRLRLSSGHDEICAGSLRNLVSGRQVGSSQVTSVVARDTSQCLGRRYPVAMRFRLVAPYFIRLSRPVLLTASGSFPSFVNN